MLHGCKSPAVLPYSRSGQQEFFHSFQQWSMGQGASHSYAEKGLPVEIGCNFMPLIYLQCIHLTSLMIFSFTDFFYQHLPQPSIPEVLKAIQAFMSTLVYGLGQYMQTYTYVIAGHMSMLSCHSSLGSLYGSWPFIRFSFSAHLACTLHPL